MNLCKKWSTGQKRKLYIGLVIFPLLAYFVASRTMIFPAYLRMVAPFPPSAQTRDARWQQDVQYLAEQLSRLHVDAFHGVSQEVFEQAITQLRANISIMDDLDITLEIMRIVAMIGDAHTKAVPPETMAYDLHPIRVSWLKDGFYVTGAITGYQDLVETRIVRIGETPIERVYQVVKPYIAHETETGLRDDIWMYLVCPDIHRHLGLVTEDQVGVYTFEYKDSTLPENSRVLTRTLSTIAPDTYFEMVTETLPAGDLLYQQSRDQFYTFTYLEEEETVYFQYNKGNEMATQSPSEFVKELWTFIETHPVARLIIDLRHNSGGDEGIFWDFIEQLAQHPLNKTGNLFVIVGRKTYSSAVLNVALLQRKTDAIFIGEPPSSFLDHYGQRASFVLPNSRIRIEYSTTYFARSLSLRELTIGDWLGAFGYANSHFPVSDAYLKPFTPNILLEPTIDDYREGRDPALAYILAH
ncbi:MAG: hypothetical protein JXA33_14720 [Anaerolineae bacterium]|nr:hypothetical protein [Anaerolineae bacterium]